MHRNTPLIPSLLDAVQNFLQQQSIAPCVHVLQKIYREFFQLPRGELLEAQQNIAREHNAVSIMHACLQHWYIHCNSSNNNSPHNLLCLFSLSLLGVLTFDNQACAVEIANNDELLELLLAILGSSTSTDGKSEVVQLLSAVASHTSTHPKILPFVPHVFQLGPPPPMQPTTTQNLHQQQRLWRRVIGTVVLTSNLSQNPACWEALHTNHAPHFLTLAIDNSPQQHHDVLVLPATVALSHLLPHPHTVLARHPHITHRLADAMSAALDGRDFPPGSKSFPTPWKLLRAMTALCTKDPVLKANFLGLGVGRLIKEALQKRQKAVVIEASLNFLWVLCSPQQD